MASGHDRDQIADHATATANSAASGTGRGESRWGGTPACRGRAIVHGRLRAAEIEHGVRHPQDPASPCHRRESVSEPAGDSRAMGMCPTDADPAGLALLLRLGDGSFAPQAGSGGGTPGDIHSGGYRMKAGESARYGTVDGV
ncbi:hypothetical protein GCM10017778_46040 [Streptomyces vinaceus]|nr:hypothetical protein GCM10017778_46040 [Streptomyces vinaceus]